MVIAWVQLIGRYSVVWQGAARRGRAAFGGIARGGRGVRGRAGRAGHGGDEGAQQQVPVYLVVSKETGL